MSAHLFGKRELKRLGSVANDGAGAGYTTFAKSMMAKMGWKEGQGLGKDMQGRSTYVQVKKKDDNAGLGTNKAHQDNVNDQWYFNAFDSALANMTGAKKKKKKKDKRRERENRDGEATETGCMYDKMFKATGGARMGMRARAAQNGKLARTEGGRDVAVVSDAKKDGVPTTDQSLEERRKRKRSKRAREANAEIDAAPADEGNGSQQNTAQMKSSGKRLRRNVVTTESGDGDVSVDGMMAETIVIVSTDTKTRKRDKLGGKRGNRVDESMVVVNAVNQATTRNAEGETAAGVKERKKKKKARTSKGSQQAITES